MTYIAVLLLYDIPRPGGGLLRTPYCSVIYFFSVLLFFRFRRFTQTQSVHGAPCGLYGFARSAVQVEPGKASAYRALGGNASAGLSRYDDLCRRAAGKRNHSVFRVFHLPSVTLPVWNARRRRNKISVLQPSFPRDLKSGAESGFCSLPRTRCIPSFRLSPEDTGLC